MFCKSRTVTEKLILIFAGFGKKEKAPPHDGVTAHFGRALRAEGHLHAQGDVRISGEFFGRIDAPRVIVEIDGYVVGDVVAKDVLIHGRLKGRVFAVNISIASTAQISGRIFHHSATVERGAQIEGRMPWRPINFFDNLEKLPETRP